MYLNLPDTNKAETVRSVIVEGLQLIEYCINIGHFQEADKQADVLGRVKSHMDTDLKEQYAELTNTIFLELTSRED